MYKSKMRDKEEILAQTENVIDGVKGDTLTAYEIDRLEVMVDIRDVLIEIKQALQNINFSNNH